MNRGTVSFNELGRFGRAGNMLFQCAAVLGIAHANGMNPVCQLSRNSRFASVFDLHDLGDGATSDPLVQHASTFGFEPRFHDLEHGREHDLRGYFQTEKYWRAIRSTIHSNFRFSDEIRERAVGLLPAGAPTVSVHVRRGDYVGKSTIHNGLSTQWYRQALELFADYRPVVFSDGIGWCRDHLTFLEDPLFIDHDAEAPVDETVMTDDAGYVDLCAMSLCDAHVSANSSMSWWSAYLGGGPTVAPRQWFGPQGPNPWDDIYPDLDNWIIL